MAEPIEQQIVDACIAQLNSTITIENGYSFDLAEELGGGGAREVDPDYSSQREFPLIDVDLFTTDVEQVSHDAQKVVGRLHLQLDVDFPEELQATGITPGKHLKRFSADVSKFLGVQQAKTNPFDVAGCTNLERWSSTRVPYGVDTDRRLTAIFDVVVHFSHLIEDPSAPAPF